MVKKVSVFSLAFFGSFIALSAGLQAQFARTYGGGMDDDAGRILATPDGGFIVVGNFYPALPWLVKLAGDGSVEWEKSYHYNLDISASRPRHTFCGTPDGGYLLVGGGAFGFWIAKTDSRGEVEWARSAPNNVLSSDWPPYAVCRAGDSGYFVVASTMVGGTPGTDTDVWVIKVSTDGSLIWQKTFGLGGWELGLSAEATADGGCVIAGMAGQAEYAAYDGQPIVFKIDPLGAVSWQKGFTVAAPYTRCEIGSIRGTEEAGYVLTGSVFKSSNVEAYPAGFVFGIGSDGTLSWSSYYGRGLSDSRPVEGGGSIVVGTAGTSEDTDILVMKLLANGDVAWQKQFGGALNEEGSSVVQTAAGDYAIAGTTISFGAGAKDICVLRISSDGELGACRFSKSTNLGGVATGVGQADISLAIADASSVSQSLDMGVSETSGISLNYRLCTEQKLLAVRANRSVAASVTSPPLGTYIYTAGQSATISVATTVTDDYGYAGTFSGWGGDASGSANPITVTVNDDMTVQALYGYDWGGDDDGGGGGGGCFIATAAFRSPLHPAVRLLREFRDRRLMTNGIGRCLVAVYYRTSPAAARVIGGSPFLRTVARILLIPVIAVAALVLKLGWIAELFLTAAAIALAFRRVRRIFRGVPSQA